ncbi:MAG: phosphoribosylanthranilate isomerase [Candidatus Goldbacteria bacterium]|nr:phosphoribosylanthranilate isomerase [Candidatus Goldiibacteriota bacterium]
MLIKICGITNIKDALYAEKFGADIIGMIFANSPRKITVLKAKKIIDALKETTKKAGVFVNEDIEKINEIINKLKLDFVQLHGDEPVQYIKKIKKAKIIKAIRVKNRRQILNDIRKYKNTVHLFLFDTYDRKMKGGTGKTFNWNLIKGIKIPFLVAGGIGCHNVKDVIKRLKPYGIDINSAVERYPGKKDIKKLKLLFKEIKNSR